MTKLKLLSKSVLFAFTGLGAAMVAAQTPASLKDAVERAILQNPEVKLRFHNLEAAQQERKGAEGAWLPRIDIEAATGSYQIKTPSLASSLNYPGSRASIQLRQTLFDGFSTLNETRRLSYSEQTAFFELLSASNQTGLEAARAYIDVLRYRDLMRLASDNFTTHQEVHDRLNQKVTAGVGRRVDLEQATGRMALAESNWVTEASNLHDVSSRYQRLVGEIPAESLAPTESWSGLLPANTRLLSEAVRKNPDFLAAVSTIRAYRADNEVRRAAYSPTLEFRARQSFETNQSGTTGDFRDSALELVLNYNLFRGGSDRARVKQYVAKLGSAFDLRDKACRDVWQTGAIAFNDSQRLVAQLKLLSQHELSTSKARQAYQQQFDIGQRSLLDLLDTENELYQARRSLSNAEYDLALAQIRVLASSGSLLSALKLQPLSNELPSANGGTEDDDELMQCSNLPPLAPTLNRDFDSRPATLPPEPVQPVPTLVAPAAAAPKTDTSGPACAQLPQVVETWLGAWNSKNIPRYLSLYSDNFVPAMGMTRNVWESLRKKRITEKKGDIQASASQLRPVRCNAQSAEVAFTQGYGSTDYRDQVEKTLSLERVQGDWKITRETVTKGRTY